MCTAPSFSETRNERQKNFSGDQRTAGAIKRKARESSRKKGHRPTDRYMPRGLISYAKLQKEGRTRVKTAKKPCETRRCRKTLKFDALRKDRNNPIKSRRVFAR